MSRSLYLVDSSVWLEVLPRGRRGTTLTERIDNLLAADLVAITGMVRLEVLGGAPTASEYERLGGLFSALHTLPIRDGSWDKAAQLGFDLRREGVVIPFIDLLIAAVAIENDAVLVHRDRHFDTCAGHSRLKCESYVAASI